MLGAEATTVIGAIKTCQSQPSPAESAGYDYTLPVKPSIWDDIVAKAVILISPDLGGQDAYLGHIIFDPYHQHWMPPAIGRVTESEKAVEQPVDISWLHSVLKIHAIEPLGQFPKGMAGYFVSCPPPGHVSFHCSSIFLQMPDYFPRFAANLVPILCLSLALSYNCLVPYP